MITGRTRTSQPLFTQKSQIVGTGLRATRNEEAILDERKKKSQSSDTDSATLPIFNSEKSNL